MRAALRFAFLLVPALFMGVPEAPRVHLVGDRPAQVASSDFAGPLAFDVGPKAPSGVAETDSPTPPTPRGQSKLRGAAGSAQVSNVARARARAAAREHSESSALALAHRTNRHFFGSTAPPPLL